MLLVNTDGAQMSHSLPDIDPLDQPVWGAEAIAKVLNRPVKQVRYGLERGRFDADKLGKSWVSTPRRLLRQFAGRKVGAPDDRRLLHP
jgi:hypothetical protein